MFVGRWTYCHGWFARVFNLDVSAETASGRHFGGSGGGGGGGGVRKGSLVTLRVVDGGLLEMNGRGNQREYWCRLIETLQQIDGGTVATFYIYVTFLLSSWPPEQIIPWPSDWITFYPRGFADPDGGGGGSERRGNSRDAGSRLRGFPTHDVCQDSNENQS